MARARAPPPKASVVVVELYISKSAGQLGEPHSNVHFSAEFEMAKPDKAGYDSIFFLLLPISTNLLRPCHLSMIKASTAIKRP